MPFQSKAQQGYLYAKKPKVARKFASDTVEEDYIKMPYRKKRKVKDMMK